MVPTLGAHPLSLRARTTTPRFHPATWHYRYYHHHHGKPLTETRRRLKRDDRAFDYRAKDNFERSVNHRADGVILWDGHFFLWGSMDVDDLMRKVRRPLTDDDVR